MKAVVVLNDGSYFSRGDIVAWGNVNYDITAYSSNSIYGECVQVEFNPSSRPTVQVSVSEQVEFVNVDFKQAHKWNFSTQQIELKNDPASQDLIIKNHKFYSIEKIKLYEKKNGKDKTKEKDNIKAKYKNGSMATVIGEINDIVDKVLKDTLSAQEKKI